MDIVDNLREIFLILFDEGFIKGFLDIDIVFIYLFDKFIKYLSD